MKAIKTMKTQRARRAIGASALALALAVGGGWAAQAETGTAAASQEKRDTAGPAAGAVPGYEVVRLPNANVPNFQRRTVYCPAGKVVLGGGAEARGNDAILVGSFPTDDNRGWIGLGRQNAYSSVGISVFAICANS
ncbi:hypothetical protein QCN29_19370 [Streptomyces sp. HNM0663]|uniref:Secreted protein n=1 Tax=Streptomyces chengmaiensis TaxID=3040919 RepID=A0ABT6HQB3_9ACTN|nr:hypothetical protein [Streptomyces chengmaiensis]MDH2390912.1 hypothetical protein [Streptomyces chengmaiensis]